MVTRVIHLLYKEVRGLHQAAYIIALFTFASQILAIVRDRMLAHTFGAGAELDIYYTAFRIPDLLFVLFASVLSVYVLLPFVSRENTVMEGRGRTVLAQFFTLFLVSYSLLALTVGVFAHGVVSYLFPAYTAHEQDILILLLRILLLQPLLLGISSIYGVITQMQHRFVLYALSPLLYNIGIIIGVVFLYPYFGLSGLAIGVIIGAFGHLAVQWPLVRSTNLSFGLVKQFDWPLIITVFKVAIPRAITLSFGQIQMLVFVMFASAMTVGSVAVLQFAYNLQSVPLAIIGMSYSVAAFPVLADLLAKGEREKYVSYVVTALRHIIFWAIPITALVIVLRAQMVRVLLGSGSFNWDDTRLTAAVLAVFVVTLLAQSMLLLIVRAFYAGGYTKIPLIVTGIGTMFGLMAVWVLLSGFTTVPVFRDFVIHAFRLEAVRGVEVLLIAIGFAIGVWIEVIVMMGLFIQRFKMPATWLLPAILRALGASIVGSFVAYAALIFVVEGVNQNTFIGIFIQGVVGGTFGIIGVIVTYQALRSPELIEIVKSFRAKIFKTDVVAPQPDII